MTQVRRPPASTPSNDEALLLQRSRSGDRDAFGTIVEIYMKRAFAIAYRLVGNREDALELSQDAFVRAYRAIKRFDVSRPFYPWFHRILRNVCYRFLSRRARRKESMLPEGLASERFDPRDLAETSETKARVWAALGELKPEHRELIVLKDLQGLKYREIAEILGIPDGTVMSRLHAARKALSAVLRPAPVGEREASDGV